MMRRETVQKVSWQADGYMSRSYHENRIHSFAFLWSAGGLIGRRHGRERVASATGHALPIKGRSKQRPYVSSGNADIGIRGKGERMESRFQSAIQNLPSAFDLTDCRAPAAHLQYLMHLRRAHGHESPWRAQPDVLSLRATHGSVAISPKFQYEIACILGTPGSHLVYSVRDGIRERVAVDCLRPSPRNEEWRPRPVFRARTVSRGAWRVLACTSTSRGTAIEAPAFPRRKGNLCASLGSTSRLRPTSSPS